MFLLWPTILLVFYGLPYYFPPFCEHERVTAHCASAAQVRLHLNFFKLIDTWSEAERGTWNMFLFLVRWQQFFFLSRVMKQALLFHHPSYINISLSSLATVSNHQFHLFESTCKVDSTLSLWRKQKSLFGMALDFLLWYTDDTLKFWHELLLVMRLSAYF